MAQKSVPLSYGSEGIELNFLNWFSQDWLINAVVLCSMILQVWLACGGAIRHSSSNKLLQLGLWLAYISADAVAIYALGSMARSGTITFMFGIFAPLLLLHLGGPDTITAYSTADNELWTRHLLTMVYQVSVAAYVIYVSRVEGRLLVAAILLYFVGAIKYAERTLALRYASYSQIVSSTKPVYEYMGTGAGKQCQYLVMGAKQWEKEYEGKTKTVRRKVTIHDVWKNEGKKATDNYLVCLSHALFKLYKRRHVSLYFHEKGVSDTRRFFTSEDLSHIPRASPEMVFTVIEMELKFLFDALFSKSADTAYSKLGATMRVLNISLLGTAGFLSLSELGRREKFFREAISQQRVVGYLLISVAFVAEFSQLCRVILSDWTLVWLICTSTRVTRNERTESHAPKLISFLIWLLGKVRRIRRRRYSTKAIHQYSVIETCSRMSPLLWKWGGYFHTRDIILMWYIKAVPIEDDLRKFVFQRVIDKCPAEESFGVCRSNLKAFGRSLVRESNCEDLAWASSGDQEHLILNWHVATTICEREYKKKSNGDGRDLERNASLGGKLSRYGAYLLVSCPNLVPVHPDIAKMYLVDLHSELVRAGNLDSLERINGGALGDGVKLAKQLLKKAEEQRWRIIANLWADLLISYAVLCKAAAHAQYLTVGGEFLTQLWVLIGHLGCGEQN